MKVERTETTLTFTKVFNAPKELVFSMFQNPNVAEWWGPETYPVGTSDQDFKVGGTWHYSMVGPENHEVWGKIIYEEIDDPNRIVVRDYFSDADGNIDETLPATKSVISFIEVDDETTLTMSGEYESAEDIQKVVEMGMIEGIEDTWDQLEALVEKSVE